MRGSFKHMKIIHVGWSTKPTWFFCVGTGGCEATEPDRCPTDGHANKPRFVGSNLLSGMQLVLNLINNDHHLPPTAGACRGLWHDT